MGVTEAFQSGPYRDFAGASMTSGPPTVSLPGTCVAIWQSSGTYRTAGERCGREATDWIGDVPLCSHHYDRAYRQTVAAWKRAFARTVEQEVTERLVAISAARELARNEQSVIYYVRRADGLIKIGVTRKFASRMAALRKEHGPLEILLVHPGAREREQELHRRFGELNVEGEWFRNTKRLALWIRKCRRDPELAAAQPPGAVDMMIITRLLTEGIRASLAASAEYRAAVKADYEAPEQMFARMMREGAWPTKSLEPVG